MRSARVRFPRLSTRFTTWVTSTEWYTGSGINSRRTAGPLRGTSGLLLGAVAATGLIPLTHAGCVERSADHLVTDARQVLHTAAADQHDRVLLEVVAFAGDVGGDLEPTGQPDTGHLPERRVRLLRGVGVDAGAHAPSLGRTPQGRGLRLGRLGGPAFADELGNRGHALPLDCELQGYFRTDSGVLPTRPHGRTASRSRAPWARSRKGTMLGHRHPTGKRGRAARAGPSGARGPRRPAARPEHSGPGFERAVRGRRRIGPPEVGGAVGEVLGGRNRAEPAGVDVRAETAQRGVASGVPEPGGQILGTCVPLRA